MNKISVIDTAKIEELYQFDVENNDDLLPELFRMFTESAPKKLSEMQEQFQKDDWKSLLRTAHTLKSSAGNLGAILVFDICKSIEEAAARNKREEIKPMLAIADAEIHTALNELSNWMGQKYADVA